MYKGRYLPELHQDAVRLVLSKLDTGQEKQSIEGALKAFQTVLPFQREEDPTIAGLLNYRDKVLTEFAHHPILAKRLQRDEHICRVAYETINRILFANLAEFEKHDLGAHDARCIYRIVAPLMGFVDAILKTWPPNSHLFRYLTSREWILNVTRLLHSPETAERNLVQRHLIESIGVLKFVQGQLTVYCRTVMLQMGLALVDAHMGGHVPLRPLSHVFIIYKACIGHVDSQTLVTSIIDYLLPSLRCNRMLQFHHDKLQDIFFKSVMALKENDRNRFDKVVPAILAVRLGRMDLPAEQAAVMMLIKLLEHRLIEGQHHAILFHNIFSARGRKAKMFVAEMLMTPLIGGLFEQPKPNYRQSKDYFGALSAFYLSMIEWILCEPLTSTLFSTLVEISKGHRYRRFFKIACSNDTRFGSLLPKLEDKLASFSSQLASSVSDVQMSLAEMNINI
jgi:hypothetical protein